jgi:16S rRNA (guanine527-N7)-methyltransferase
MLSRNSARKLLAPFELKLSDETIDTLLQYLELLVRWNRKINLTSIRTAEECITRHFGESLLVSKVVPLEGRLLDIGSGAGFPGLAIKLVAPEVEVVLLEPVAKKRAFLKEVARTCGFGSVLVAEERIEGFSQQQKPNSFDTITARAVGGLDTLVPAAERLLKPGGWLCLWAGSQQVEGIRKAGPNLQWIDSVPIPLSRGTEIVVGRTGEDFPG